MENPPKIIPLAVTGLAFLTFTGLVTIFATSRLSRARIMVRATTILAGMLTLIGLCSLPWITTGQSWEGINLLVAAFDALAAASADGVSLGLLISTLTLVALAGLIAISSGLGHILLGAFSQSGLNVLTILQAGLAVIGLFLLLVVYQIIPELTFLTGSTVEITTGFWITLLALLLLLPGALADYIYYWDMWDWEYE